MIYIDMLIAMSSSQMYLYVLFGSIPIVHLNCYNIIFMLQLIGESIINIVTCTAIGFLFIFFVVSQSLTS